MSGMATTTTAPRPRSDSPRSDRLAQGNLSLGGMHCASCVSTIEGSLAGVDGVEEANVNLATERARVTYDPRRTNLGDLIAVVESVGYSARGVGMEGRDSVEQQEQRARRERQLLGAKFVFSAAAGALLLGLAFVWSPLGERATVWAMLALATPVQFWAGWQFYTGAWKVARHRSADMNTLIAVGTSASYVYSLVATVAPGVFESDGQLPDVYFETAAVIIALVLLGRLL